MRSWQTHWEQHYLFVIIQCVMQTHSQHLTFSAGSYTFRATLLVHIVHNKHIQRRRIHVQCDIMRSWQTHSEQHYAFVIIRHTDLYTITASYIFCADSYTLSATLHVLDVSYTFWTTYTFVTIQCVMPTYRQLVIHIQCRLIHIQRDITRLWQTHSELSWTLLVHDNSVRHADS